MHIIFTAKYKVLQQRDFNWDHFNNNIIASHKLWQIITIFLVLHNSILYLQLHCE